MTSAFLAPVRTISRPTRCPKQALIASITIDFPAPVSPVNTVSPDEKSIDGLLDDGKVLDIQLAQHLLPSLVLIQYRGNLGSQRLCLPFIAHQDKDGVIPRKGPDHPVKSHRIQCRAGPHSPYPYGSGCR